MAEDEKQEMLQPHLHLRLEPLTHTVIIDGDCANLDMALAILTQATRHVETEWRVAKALEAQAKAKQEIEANARVKNLINMGLRQH